MNARGKRFRSVAPCAVLVLAALAAAPVRWSIAQSSTETAGEAEVRAHYTKYNIKSPCATA